MLVSICAGCVPLHRRLPDRALDWALTLPWLRCYRLFTAFPFAIVLGYCVQDIAAASESLVPLFAIMEQATRSRAAAVVFLVAIAGGVAIGIQACILATSRLMCVLCSRRCPPLQQQ